MTSRPFRVYDPLYTLALCLSLTFSGAVVYLLTEAWTRWFGAFAQ